MKSVLLAVAERFCKRLPPIHPRTNGERIRIVSMHQVMTHETPGDLFRKQRCRPICQEDYMAAVNTGSLPVPGIGFPIGCLDTQFKDDRCGGAIRIAFLTKPEDPLNPDNWRTRLIKKPFGHFWRFAVVDLD